MPDLETVARLDIRDALADVERLGATLDELDRPRILKLETAAAVRELQRVNREIAALTGDRTLGIEVDQRELLAAARLREDIGGVAAVDVDVDSRELLTAARLREDIGGTASVDVDVDQRELLNAARVKENIGGVANVDVDVDSRDLLNAARLREDIGGTASVDVDVDARELLSAARLREDLNSSATVRVDADTQGLSEAVRLRGLLDDLVARVEVDTDLGELEQAFDLAQRLNSLRAFIDVDTNGGQALREVLDIGQQLERLVAVVRVEARDEALREALQTAERIDSTFTARINVDDGELERVRRFIDGDQVLTIDVETGEILEARRLIERATEDQTVDIRAELDNRQQVESELDRLLDDRFAEIRAEIFNRQQVESELDRLVEDRFAEIRAEVFNADVVEQRLERVASRREAELVVDLVGEQDARSRLADLADRVRVPVAIDLDDALNARDRLERFLEDLGERRRVPLALDVDTEFLGNRLRDALTTISDRVGFDLQLNTDRASSAVDDLVDRLRVPFDLDLSSISEARAQIADLTDRVRSPISFDFDIPGLDRVRETIADLSDRVRVPFDFEFNIESVDIARNRIRDSIEDLSERVRIPFQFDLEDLDGLGDRVRNRLSDISDRIRLPFDADLTSVREAIKNLQFDPIELEANIDVDRLGSQLLALDFRGIGATLGDSLTDGVKGRLSALVTRAGPVGAAGLAAGAVFAAALADGIAEQNTRIRRAVRFGLDADEASDVGRSGGEAYVSGFAASLDEGRDIAAVIQSRLDRVDPTLDLSEATDQVALLADLWQVDVDKAIRFAERSVSTGFTPSVDNAFSVLIAANQEFGASADEVLDALIEFGPQLDRAGISAAKAAQIIGEIDARGLQSGFDRVADSIQELFIRLEVGDSEDAIGRLGLSLTELQTLVQTNRAPEVFELLITQLGTIQDEGERVAVAAELFGSQFEESADKAELLEVIMSDVSGRFADVEGNAFKAGEAIESTLSQQILSDFRRFLTFLNDADAALGGLAERLNDVFDDLLFSRASGGIRGFFGFDSQDVIDVNAEIAKTTSRTNEVKQELLGIREVGIDVDTVEAQESLEEMEDRFERLAKSADVARDAVLGVFDFSGDAAVREVNRLAGELEEALGEIDINEAFDFTGQIDFGTEAGRELSEILESASSAVGGLVSAYSEGSLSQAEFEAASRRVDDALREQLGNAGVLGFAVDDLVQKYGSAAASDEIQGLIRSFDAEAIALFRTELEALGDQGIAELGIDIDIEASVAAALRAREVLQTVTDDIRIGIDVNGDDLVGADELLRSFTALERNARIGFDIDDSGFAEFEERALAFQQAQYFASIGFDLNLDGITDAEERLRAYDLLTSFADIGYEVNEAGLVAAIASGEAFDIRDFISDVAFDYDPSELNRAEGEAQEFENDPAVKPLDADSRRFFEKVNGVRATSSALEQNPIELTIRARDQATAEIDRIARNRTSYVQVVTRRTNSIIQADGGIIGSDGTEYMESGGVLNGIHKAQPGGVSSFFNGRHVITAENGGDELFLNQYSRPSRQIELIQSFAGGQLDQHLRRHYQGSSGGDDGMLRRIASSLERIEAQGPGDVPIQVVAPDNPILDPVLYAKELARQTRREARARALAGAGR